MVLRNLMINAAVAALVAGASVGLSTTAMAQTFGYQNVSEDSVSGFIGAIPTSSPAIMVASDGESPFHPFGLTFDVSDAIQLNSDWAPDPGFASAFGADGWQQQVGTDIWYLAACLGGVCENGNVVEPVGKWDFTPGSGWNPGTLGLRILEADGSLSDLVTVANDGPTGGATITFDSNPVPEPATWALMLLGFGGLGTAIRSRRRLATA